MDLMRKAEDESKKQESALATNVSSNEVEVCICDLILLSRRSEQSSNFERAFYGFAWSVYSNTSFPCFFNPFYSDTPQTFANIQRVKY